MNKRIIPQFRDTNQVHKVSLYQGGAMFNPGTIVPNPTGKGGGKRGKIGGWSMASRRRMRETLLTARWPGFDVYGVTLTIPGPVLAPERSQALWADFSSRVNKSGLSAIWRVEIQERGALHWHLLAATPEGQDPKIWSDLWLAALSRVGSVSLVDDLPEHATTKQVIMACQHVLKILEVFPWPEQPDYVGVKFGQSGKTILGKYPRPMWDEIRRDHISLLGDSYVIAWHNLAYWPGAEKYCCDISHNDGSGSWLRYLNDHSTKCKQEQIPVDIGRHWGIIGRKHLKPLEMPEVEYLSRKEYHQVRRMFERLATGSGKNDKAPFGRSLMYKVKVGRFGRSVRFCRPETLKRMIDFVLSQRF